MEESEQPVKINLTEKSVSAHVSCGMNLIPDESIVSQCYLRQENACVGPMLHYDEH